MRRDNLAYVLLRTAVEYDTHTDQPAIQRLLVAKIMMISKKQPAKVIGVAVLQHVAETMTDNLNRTVLCSHCFQNQWQLGKTKWSGGLSVHKTWRNFF